MATTAIPVAGVRTPVRRGNIYCSPWCGANCTHIAFDRATKEAAALAKSLGNGWEPEVWENMGWHYCVANGAIEVYANRTGSTTGGKWTVDGYSADLKAKGAPQIIGDGATAKEALQAVQQKVQTLRDAIVAATRFVDGVV